LAKLRVLGARAVCRILEQHGFQETRRSGSHIVMKRRLPDTTITVLVPNHREIREGTLESIIGQSRLPRSLFETP
jgi:predicted RNA binding protein YcfA (HicA-like mRNA interferase family)